MNIIERFVGGSFLENLSDLPNVGSVLLEQLKKIGVETPEALRAAGAHEVFSRIRANDPGACLHMLYGIEGAIRGVQDKDLPQEAKDDLKKFFRALPKEPAGTPHRRT